MRSSLERTGAGTRSWILGRVFRAVVGLWFVFNAPVRAGEIVELDCSDVGSVPFLAVDLSDALPVERRARGVAETWIVNCPDGVSPCPETEGSMFTPPESGRYEIEFFEVGGDPRVLACTFDLHVKAPGLVVELHWDWDDGLGPTMDLDLLLHEPGTAEPWGISSAHPSTCSYQNCTVSDFDPITPDPAAPDWFDGTPPAPAAWILETEFEANTCYLSPQNGADWQALGMGCHSPRLTLQNTSCDPVETDPIDSQFCHPETIQVDIMPEGEWTRIGVHHFSNAGAGYDVRPRVHVYCDYELVAILGDAGPAESLGYATEVVFPAAGAGSLFWLVADVRFPATVAPGEPACEIVPLLDEADEAVFTTVTIAEVSFGPSYPLSLIFADGFESGNLSAWASP